ncbi:universal stress protein [Halarchaeum acidiphilum MH1-52-1]|uniref:Universal stress protein n=1 Tax=Halarchaeum acidiphilum MH1-52-1 TaxID=1261545 RepID=U2YG90_9EURY|nr:universal stress protein [Halarchaeum acidiphilum]GAD53251.1 universal stress protein [Halarchaeum acidiphilum MH1-52-1]
MTYANVLVPTDGSGGVQDSMTQALDLAELSGATVHGLYVVDESLRRRLTRAAFPGDELRVAGENAVASIEGAAHRAGLDARTEIRRGDPASAILDYVGENDIDLVVMGTHGRTGAERAVLGSTTERVLHRADVPVLVVHATEHE